MNIFRLLGDMSHTASILFLLLKLRASKSAAGEKAAHASFTCLKFFLWWSAESGPFLVLRGCVAFYYEKEGAKSGRR